MNESMTLGRRMFSAAIASLTILATAGFAAFAVPQTAGAASDEGDLIKGSLSAVYYHAYDGMRYAFPNTMVFMTWYNDFDDVETLDDSDIADITLGGNVVYRPGSTWVKITTDPKTYAVSTGMMLHWIETESVATDFAGSDWNTNIHDVSDVFFADYTVGTSLMSADAFDGMTYMDGGNYYLAWDGEKRMLTDDGRMDNMFDDSAFLDGAGIDDSALSMGDDVDGQLCALVDAAQQNCDGAEEMAMGDVEVSLATSSPDGTNIPKGVTSLEVAAFDFEAGDEDAEVDELTFRMYSLGATTNVSNVYLYEGNSRITDSRSINSSTREVTFGSLNLDIEAGETRTFSVRVEIASGASTGDLVGFELQNADAVTVEGGDIDGSFPVRADEHEISGTTVGTVTVTKSGTITNPSLGQKTATIGKFKVAVATEDASIEVLTLKIDNAADHDNFMLYDDSTLVAEGEYIGDKLVLFELDDEFDIERGSSNVFTVKADVGGDSSDAVKVFFDNKNDLTAIGGDYGFNMNVDIGSSGTYDGATCTSSSGNCSYSAVEGGDVSIVFDGPSTGKVSVNASAQNIFEFTITTQAAITVKDLDIIVYADDDADGDATDAAEGGTDTDTTGLIGASSGNISNIRLVNKETGSTVMGPLELDSTVDGGDDADQTIDFTNDFEMDEDESLTLQVLVDTESGLASGTELAAALDISGLVLEDANGDSITNSTSVTPVTDLTGNNQEALSATLTVSLGSSGSKTHVQGSSNEFMNSFNLKAGEAGTVTVSAVTLSVYAHDAASGTFQLGDCAAADECASSDVDVQTFISTCTIEDSEGMQIGTAKSPSSDGNTVSFDDFAWEIGANANEEVNVYCSFNPSAAAYSGYFGIDIADVSEDIVAEDSEAVSVTATGDAVNGGTSPTNVVTVAESGTVNVTLHSSTPDADFLVTSAAEDWNLVAVYDATATNEDFMIKEITFKEYAATALGQSASAYNNNIERVRLDYPTEDGAGATAYANIVGSEVEFTGIDGFVEFGASSSLFSVYVDVPGTDRVSGDATSNERVSMAFDVDGSADDQFRAVGQGSSVVKNDDDESDITNAATFVVKETYPTVALSATSPSGAAVPSDLAVLKFNVTAHSNEGVVIDELIFTMSATDNAGTPTKWINCDGDANDVQASSFDFYQNAGTLTKLDASDAEWTLLASDGDTCDVTADTGAGEPVKFVRLDLATPEVVPAGTTATYELHFNAAGASSSSDDSIQFGLAEDPIVAEASFLAGSDLDDVTAVTDATIPVTATTSYSVGDIVCLDDEDDACDADDELALVTGISAGVSLTVVRGYLGTTPVAAGVAADDVDRIPGAFFWQDDGTNASSATGEYWGSYLVDGLELTGGALTF
ncbi:MAG: hypothetical protein O3B64_00805 [bacterium]|nr:hypothetical protein [bacterium]